MEFFIPSLLLLLFAGITTHFLLPKLSAYVLVIVTFGLFILAVWQHYRMFPYEYTASMITDLMKQYSGFIMLFAVIFAGVVGISLVNNNKSSNTSNLSSMFAPSNNSKSIVTTVTEMMPQMSIPAMPDILGNSKGANNKGLFNLGGNNRKNNVASTSFKTV
jgi:hypothetical protein